MIVEPALFVAAQAGEPAALDQVLRIVQPNIRRYARTQCHRTSAIEDVVQEALLIVYRRIGTVRDVTALTAWLLKVVARLCMLPALALVRGTETLEANVLFARAGDDELRIDICRALESLPPIYREAVLLRDVEQLTIGEMAARLAITREAAKSRIHRARALMREYLDAGA